MTALPASADPSQVLDLLQCAEAGNDSGKIEQIETHISWVFLTSSHAYKLKKPVRFEFLDFSTAQLRGQACEDEVRLNRRLAPDVYLAVMPVYADRQGGLRLIGEGCGDGTPIDWLVKMRRLRAEQSLDRQIEAGGVTAPETDSIAEMLCRFFQDAARGCIEPAAYCSGIERHVRANAAELTSGKYSIDIAPARNVCGSHLRWLALRRELLEARVRDGRVIEGHGDLRPEHIYIENGQPVVIDCIEFSRELRTLDVADELSFLAMECDRLGAEPIGRRLIEVYEERTGDQPPAALWGFYKSYRACVRAKVAALRSAQQSPEQQQASLAECRHDLSLAGRYARSLLPPMLIVVRGLMGTGKSTLAAALSDSLGLETLATDAIRRELFPATGRPAGYGEGTYQAEARERVYADMFRRAQQLLAWGASLILDGTFLSSNLRRRAVEIGKQAKAVTLIVTCTCPSEVATERIRIRQIGGGSLSEARPELLALQMEEEEPVAEDLPHLLVDTSLPVHDQKRGVIQWLAGQLDETKYPSCSA